MKKISYIGLILGTAALGFVGCSPAAVNSNKAVLNTNTNTAILTNSNVNAAPMNSSMDSNMNSSTNANLSPSKSKELSSSDKEFMMKAAQGGMEEVKLGEMAATKAQSAEVRTFGQKMVFDHTNANDKLKAIAAQKNVTLPTDVSSEQKQDMDKLSKLSGAAFDKEYVRMMVADHEKDVAEFQKQIDTGNEMETKAFALETLPTLKIHLQMIKNISDRVK